MSTAVELVGFACAVVAATLLGGPAAGWVSAAVALLVIGYALEDDKAAVALGKRRAQLKARRAIWRQRRDVKRAARQKTP